MGKGDPDVFVISATCGDITAYGFPKGVASRGSGAGLTYEIAYGAAIGEAVERYACSIMHPEDLLFGSYSEMCKQGRHPIPPHSWALLDPSQYERVSLSPFLEDTPIAWAPAESLTEHRDCLVPACMVYMPYSRAFDDRGEKIISYPISTGAACSHSRVDALLKGLCEVVERDAFIIMWRNRLPCPRVRIDEQSELYSIFHEKFARPGLEYTLVYTTLDLQIPSFFGILTDTRREWPMIFAGGAAHPDPVQAAHKTLIELAHGLKWMDYFEYGPLPVEPGFRNVRSFEDRVRLYAFNDMREAFRFLWDHRTEIPLSSIPGLDTGDTRSNLHRCLDVLKEQGLQVVATDLTPVDVQECGFYVVRVMIPECEPLEGDHLIPFLGGQRWREVPYRLGLVSSKPTVGSINPYPHPYP
jgi:ribosomal protein S12 methylthiotransferase accessory factor